MISKNISKLHDRKKRIQQLMQDVRKKYLALKLGKTEGDETVQRLFSPIIKRLDQIVDEKKIPVNQQNTQRASSVSNKDLDEEENEDISQKTVNENLKVSDIMKDYLGPYPPPIKDYIHQAWIESSNIDLTFGPKYDPNTCRWILGKTPMDFDPETSEILVGKERFPGTKGLYELLFSKIPTVFDDIDKENYKKILIITNVYRRHSNPMKPPKSNGGFKYKRIIGPLIQEGHSGSGLMSYNERPIEYIYWDNIDELISRLRLLHSSKLAGNSSNDNEIQSIIEELREAGVIN